MQPKSKGDKNLSDVIAQLSPVAGPGTVCAIVVTYNRLKLLQRVLEGLAGQSRRPDAILVINNASTDNTQNVLARSDVLVLELERNSGSAGGFYNGTVAAHEAGFEWIWIMDDDVEPSSTCLEKLLSDPVDGEPALVRAPLRIESDGDLRINEAILDFKRHKLTKAKEDTYRIDVYTFEGSLVHRTVFDAVGYPDVEYFLSSDDTDFAIRTARSFGHGASIRVKDASMQRLLPAQEKHWPWIFNTMPLIPDEHFWKVAYYLRNRHLLWRQLNWPRRRYKQALLHAGFIVCDTCYSLFASKDWLLRAKLNYKAWHQGILGVGGSLVDPQDYLEKMRKAGASE